MLKHAFTFRTMEMPKAEYKIVEGSFLANNDYTTARAKKSIPYKGLTIILGRRDHIAIRAYPRRMTIAMKNGYETRPQIIAKIDKALVSGAYLAMFLNSTISHIFDFQLNTADLKEIEAAWEVIRE
jgi:hypothetical protein